MEAIGQLAGGVAHDFNNILAVIQMQSDLLEMRRQPFRRTVGVCRRDSRHCSTRRRPDPPIAPLQPPRSVSAERSGFERSIANTAKMLQRILGENVQMQLKFAPQPLFIHADAGMMDQVLMNLAVNARDAMPDGGQLVIETSGSGIRRTSPPAQSAQARPGSFVCLSVSDTGCGIPPEILPAIFEPFFTTKDVGKGTGLGLATVFGIVQQHQGWVNVYSEVGHGTTFRIYLPRLAKNTGQRPRTRR